MHALNNMCWQVLFELKRRGFVTFVTDSRLKKMGEDIPGKGPLAYTNNNILLLDHASTPILSILLTALGKQLVPGSTKNWIQDVIAVFGLKEQDFTETFLKRGHAFGMSDGKEWCRTTAWCFGENFAQVVVEREVQKIKQQERRAGTAARGPPKPRTPKTEVGAKDPPKKAARGSLKLCAPKTPVGSKDRPKKAQKASETDACQSVLPPAGATPAAHADALDLGGNGLAIQAAAYPQVHFHVLAGACSI